MADDLPPPPRDVLATLVTRWGLRSEVTIARARVLYVVTITGFGERLDKGVLLGSGETRHAALTDAQACLQAALDGVDVAIVKEER